MVKKIFGDFKISLPIFILLLGLGFFIGILIPLNTKAYPACTELFPCQGYWWTDCTQYNYDECCDCCEWYGAGSCMWDTHPICEHHVRFEHINECAQTCGYHEGTSSISYCGTECEATISGTTCTYPAGSICENATCGSCNYHTCDVCDLCSGYKSPSPEAGCVSGTGCFIPSGSSCQCVKDVCGAECAKDSDCPTGKECDTSTCTCITPCECTSTTIGGCCDGCNYCPAGKVFNGTSCVDATETVRCGYQNVCTAGSCSGYVKNRECKAGGVCDDTDTYYTTTDKYASAGKVLTSSCTNQNATSSVKCASTVNKCTAGNCSGEKRYPECQSGGVCDSSATTYYTSDPVDASAGCSLTSSCGNQCNSTIESQLCDSTWRASSGIGDNNYGKGGDYNCQGMCDGSGLCEYAVNCTGCDCTSWANQSCGYPSCDSYHMGQTRTCTPSGCDTEFRCICSESCCTSWSNQGCGAGGCAATEMYQIRTCGSDCSYSTSQCVSDPSCGGVITINPPQVTTVAATNVTQTSATLNGYLDSLGYDPGTCPSCSCIVWFKWKLSTATTWNETTPVSMATEGPFSANISGLTSNTTYYFEAFAKNGGSW